MIIEKDLIQGVFRGFTKGGVTFEADMTIRYSKALNSRPVFGQFILVQLENVNEAVLGRVTSYSAERALRDKASEKMEPFKTENRETELRYRVHMRALGVIREEKGKIFFVASHRRLPHVGAPVAFPSSIVLKALTNHDGPGIEIGHLALGEYIYAGDDKRLPREPWMVVMEDQITPRFDVKQLVSRRTCVFARAGYGKSNLVKLLCAELFKEQPTVKNGQGREVPVAGLILDNQGEYYWSDHQGRAALCDVPELEDKIVLFTDRAAPTPYYGSFIASGIKLDIRKLPAADVMSLVMTAERQDNQNVLKLKSLSQRKWAELVDEAHEKGFDADLDLFQYNLRLKDSQEAEALAAKSNVLRAVRMLHDPDSLFLERLFHSLEAGKLCVVDTSLIRGAAALALSGLLLKLIFERNQREYTEKDPRSIPVVAIVEEAQAVLGRNADTGTGESIFEMWQKEGRKFMLGSVLITQQPGALPDELLSQVNTFVILHLISESDLKAASRANAQISSDILSSILNEPLHGQGIIWSDSNGLSYPIPIRIMSFENRYTPADKATSQREGRTFAQQMKCMNLTWSPGGVADDTVVPSVAVLGGGTPASGRDAEPDVEFETMPQQPAAIPQTAETHASRITLELCTDPALSARLNSERGMPWAGIKEEIAKRLPVDLPNAGQKAFELVPLVMDKLHGVDAWHTVKRPSVSNPGKTTTWVVRKAPVPA